MQAPKTDESGVLGAEDMRIVRSLLCSPRASFATIGRVIGLSPAAVRRRHAALVDDGALRGSGVVDPGALGQSRWLVRLRCRPGSVAGIAEALAERDDVSWVSIGAGGSEVTCAVRSQTREQREALLERRLPSVSAIVDFTASAILRQFLGGRGHYWGSLDTVLTAEQERALGQSSTPFVERAVVARPPVELDGAERRLLEALRLDGRASLVDLARAAGLTSGQAGRRLDSLGTTGVVDVEVEVPAAVLGFGVEANLWLTVRPRHLQQVGRDLALIPRVSFVAAVSGSSNLVAQVHARDLDELWEIVSVQVGRLDDISDLELSPVLRHVKLAGSRVVGGRLRP